MKNIFIKIIKNIRKFLTFWIFIQTQDFLKKIREHELKKIIKNLPPKSRILEIGGGSGWQAKILESLGHNVSSIDIENSFYLKKKFLMYKLMMELKYHLVIRSLILFLVQMFLNI